MNPEAVPFLSIIIPTYNREKMITKTLESIKSQSCQKFELIIVDDGSTDDTALAVEPYISETIKYYKKENGERGVARNYGVAQSAGQYVTFLDSDDLLYPDHIEVAHQFINDHPEVKVFHSGYDIANSSGEILSSQKCAGKNINRELLKGNLLSCIGVFLRKDIATKFQFNENRELSGSEDWELWVRIACHHNFICTEKVTACMIQHNARSVLNINSDAIISRIHLAYDTVTSYPPFLKKYSRLLFYVKSHLFLYLSLHLAMSGDSKRAIYFFKEAVRANPSILFSRKPLGILKVMIGNL
jgi:glycosyltransferase involved in cell wall biosynthesis